MTIASKRILAAAAACTILLTAVNALATDLSDNLAAAPAGAESATSSRRLAASFGTDAAVHTLHSVTLLLANPTAGAATVSIYTEAGLEPGALVGTLVSPPSYTSTVSQTVFITPGIPLAANTTYWVVLTPQSGQFDWSWTTSNTGTGAGFQHTWANSDDGALWWSTDIYPVQMKVTVDACSNPTVTSSPSPSSGCAGRSVSFTVAGSGSPTYQWRRNAVPLSNGGRVSGATSPTLSISSVIFADAGSYDCVLTNSCGTATSSAAALGVCIADYNCDGSINPSDVAGFVNAWVASLQNGNLAADLDADGAVTPADVAMFVSTWFSALTSGC